MSKSRFAVKVNGQLLHHCFGQRDLPMNEFIKFAKEHKPGFDETKDLLEVECIDDVAPKLLFFNKDIGTRGTRSYEISINRQLNNLIAVYGAELVERVALSLLKKDKVA